MIWADLTSGVVRGPSSRVASLDEWESNGEGASLAKAGALGGDRTAVQLDQSLDQGKANAKPSLRALEGAVHLGEHLEHLGQHLGRDAKSGVRDADNDFPPSRAAASSIEPPSGVYLAALVRRLLTTWARRVGSASSQSGSSGRASFRACREASMIGPARLDGGLDHGPQRHPLLPERELIIRDAGHVQQVVDEPHHVRKLAVHHIASVDGNGRVLRHVEHMETAPERSERVPELVGEGGQELVLPPVGLLQGFLGPLPVGDVLGHRRARIRPRPRG